MQARVRLLGDLVEKTLDPLVRKRGFANARLFAQWETVVGARLASLAMPEEIKWRRGRDEGGTLFLGCSSGDALEVQHMHGLVIERINAFLGWRAIEAVRLQTGRRRTDVAQGTGATLEGRTRAAPIPKDEHRLETALDRLGGAVTRSNTRR